MSTPNPRAVEATAKIRYMLQYGMDDQEAASAEAIIQSAIEEATEPLEHRLKLIADIEECEVALESRAAATGEPRKGGLQCCERDHDFDGNCDRHPATPRGEQGAEQSVAGKSRGEPTDCGRGELETPSPAQESNSSRKTPNQSRHTGSGDSATGADIVAELRQLREAIAYMPRTEVDQAYLDLLDPTIAALSQRPVSEQGAERAALEEAHHVLGCLVRALDHGALIMNPSTLIPLLRPAYDKLDAALPQRPGESHPSKSDFKAIGSHYRELFEEIRHILQPLLPDDATKKEIMDLIRKLEQCHGDSATPEDSASEAAGQWSYAVFGDDAWITINGIKAFRAVCEEQAKVIAATPKATLPPKK